MTIKKNQIDDYISDSTQTELDWKLSLDGTDTMSWNLSMWGNNIVWGWSVSITWNYLWTNYNGVALTNAWVATNFLQEDGNYWPAWSSAPVDSVNGQTWVVVLNTWDITEVTDKNYVTDAEWVVIWNTSWTNTWDQTEVTWKSWSTDSLNSATTTVDVSGATAPTVWQVLTATSDTAATWQDWWGGGGISEIFSAYKSTNQSLTQAFVDIIFNTETKDSWGNFNTVTGEYTVPSDWTYEMRASIQVQSLNVWDRIIIVLKKGASTVWQTEILWTGWVLEQMFIWKQLELVSSDIMSVQIINASGVRGQTINNTYSTYFEWYKIA